MLSSTPLAMILVESFSGDAGAIPNTGASFEWDFGREISFEQAFK